MSLTNLFSLRGVDLVCNMKRGQNIQNLSVMPEDISRVMQLADISMVFDYLETTFHISTNWRLLYKNELQTQPRGISELEFFCKFLKEHIEPPINKLRMRDDTLFAMLRYLLKDRIEERRQEENFYRRHQHRDSRWSKGR